VNVPRLIVLQQLVIEVSATLLFNWWLDSEVTEISLRWNETELVSHKPNFAAEKKNSSAF
jgi:hypothetical protein